MIQRLRYEGISDTNRSRDYISILLWFRNMLLENHICNNKAIRQSFVARLDTQLHQNYNIKSQMVLRHCSPKFTILKRIDRIKICTLNT